MSHNHVLSATGHSLVSTLCQRHHQKLCSLERCCPDCCNHLHLDLSVWPSVTFQVASPGSNSPWTPLFHWQCCHPHLKEKTLVAPTFAVTMGWTEAPPCFTGTAEKANCLANWSLFSGEMLRPHLLEQHADPNPAAEQGNMVGSLAPQECLPIPTAPVCVFIGNIIDATQGNAQQHLQVTWAILHSVDKAFQPLDPTDLPEHQELVSLKKLDKGNGCMSAKNSSKT